jgi:hypothetical protein
MANRYTSFLPKPTEDTREAVAALREFAEALQGYAGVNADVEVSVTVDQIGGAEKVAEVLMSVYVPKTDYANVVLSAVCQGDEGFPVKVKPYFAGGSFPNGFDPCQDRAQLDNVLEQFIQSSEIRSLLDYMKRHAQKK